MKRTFLKITTYFVSLVIIALLFSFLDVRAAVAAVAAADAYSLFLVVALAGSVLFLKAYRWHMLLVNGGSRTDALSSCLSMFAGLFASVLTPGRLGDPVRAYFLKKLNNEKMSGTVPLVVVERIVDVILLVSVSVAGTLMFMSELGVAELQFLEVIAFFTFLVLGFVLLFLNRRFTSLFIVKMNQAFNLRIDRALFNSAVERSSRGRFLFSLILVTFFVWIFEGYVLYFSLVSVGIDLNPIVCFVVVSLSFLAGTVTFLPGGFGSFEATMIVLIGLFVPNMSGVVGAVIVYRFLSYLVLIVLGVVSIHLVNERSSAGSYNA